MLIRDMFAKPIDREIQGVIIVGQDENANVQQELEEYVVTRELQKHFADFFASYKKGIVGTTPKMGVWTSGFFGSGKSHFLKILSYLLENREVGGKQAIDYFIEDKKIVDPMVLADMQLAANTSTDVVLFNIDSKSDSNGKANKDAIVNVFFKVFNEMQGFCGSMPFLADLERRLTEDGQYEEFKANSRKPMETAGKTPGRTLTSFRIPSWRFWRAWASCRNRPPVTGARRPQNRTGSALRTLPEE